MTTGATLAITYAALFQIDTDGAIRDVPVEGLPVEEGAPHWSAVHGSAELRLSYATEAHSYLLAPVDPAAAIALPLPDHRGVPWSREDDE